MLEDCKGMHAFGELKDFRTSFLATTSLSKRKSIHMMQILGKLAQQHSLFSKKRIELIKTLFKVYGIYQHFQFLGQVFFLPQQA